MNKAGCLIVILFFLLGLIASLTGCCANTCGQGAPALRPMPECGVYVIEDIIEIPVTPSGK
jgi:hypothetical protein